MATRPFAFQSKFQRGLSTEEIDWDLDKFLSHAEAGGVIVIEDFVACLEENDHLDYFLEHPTSHYKESIVNRMFALRDDVREYLQERYNFSTQAAKFVEKFAVWKGSYDPDTGHDDLRLKIRDPQVALNPDVIQGQQGLLLWDSVEVRDRSNYLVTPKFNLIVFSDSSWVLNREDADVAFGFESATLADELADILYVPDEGE